jgi:peptide/nickel transport system substrate-binding protein
MDFARNNRLTLKACSEDSLRHADTPARSRRYKTPSLLAGSLLIASLLGACGRVAPPAPGTLTFLIESGPINLDPRFATDAQSQNVDGLLFSSLVAHDAQMNIVPDVAQSWEMPDPKTFIFHLRSGVKFHDGRALTSADVKFTFDSVLNGISSPNGMVRSTKRGSFDRVASIEAPDPLTVIFHLSEPRASFLWDMTRPAIGIVPNGSDTSIRYHPVGSGPFRFVSMVQDETVDVDRNLDYFAQPADRPGDTGTLVEHVHFRVVPDTVVRALELRKGSADIAGVSALIPDMTMTLKSDAGVAVADDPGTSLSYVAFNVTDPILAHREVRQALDYATDRDSIIRYLLRGEARPAASLLPTGHWANDPDLKPRPYDPSKAEQLLDAAGLPRGKDGVRFHLTLKTTNVQESTRLLGETLADQWKRVGVILEIRALETATFFADIARGNFQLFTLKWLGANNDPSFYEYVFSSAKIPPNGYNRGRYSNPGVDALIAQERVEMDREKQKPIIWQIQRVIADDTPFINLWFNDTVCEHRTRVTNVHLDPAGDYNFLEKVRLVQ